MYLCLFLLFPWDVVQYDQEEYVTGGLPSKSSWKIQYWRKTYFPQLAAGSSAITETWLVRHFLFMSLWPALSFNSEQSSPAAKWKCFLQLGFKNYILSMVCLTTPADNSTTLPFNCDVQNCHQIYQSHTLFWKSLYTAALQDDAVGGSISAWTEDLVVTVKLSGLVSWVPHKNICYGRGLPSLWIWSYLFNLLGWVFTKLFYLPGATTVLCTATKR